MPHCARFVSIVAAGLAHAAAAQDLVAIAKVVDPLAVEEQNTGRSVALDAGWLAVGAPYDDVLGEQSGSVLLHRLDGASWLPAGKLTAHDGGELDTFGAAVALSGDTLVVGAPGQAVPGDGAEMPRPIDAVRIAQA